VLDTCCTVLLYRTCGEMVPYGNVQLYMDEDISEFWNKFCSDEVKSVKKHNYKIWLNVGVY